jgi:dCMP deaminase
MNYKLYLNIAKEVAKASKCFSRQIGSVLVTQDGTIVGTGYNGPPRKTPHCDSQERLEWLTENLRETHVGDIGVYLLENGWGNKCPRHILGFKSGEGLWVCPAAHSERNALINSAREGIRTKGCILVMNCSLPCVECCKEIINAGISKIVCLDGDDYDTGARWLLNNSNIEIVYIKE